MTDPKDDARIAWCREHIDGFSEAQDKALRARADTEESRKRYAKVANQQPVRTLG